MKIQNSYAPSAPLRPAGDQAFLSWGPPAPADTYGPTCPEDLHGLYRRTSFDGSPQ